MIESDDFRPTFSRRAMRIDQCLRINLEMRFGRRVNVWRRPDGLNATALPQQYPAAFVGMNGACLIAQRGDHFACNLDVHRAWT